MDDARQPRQHCTWKRISSQTLEGEAFLGAGYERLFPQPAKMYFSGCDVAADDAGWRFLEIVGNAFLHAEADISRMASRGPVGLFGSPRRDHPHFSLFAGAADAPTAPAYASLAALYDSRP